VPVIGSFGITGWHDDARSRAPGVTIGRSGASIGTAVYVDVDYWPLNTCLYVTDFKGNDPRWVFHVLDLIDFAAYNSGSAQPSLNRNYLAQIPIAVPPPDEQERIAGVLRALDDLIETDRRAIADILELAMTAFSQHTATKLDMVRLGDVTTKIGSGATPRGGKDVYQQSGIAFIRSQNVYDGHFAFDGLARISDAAADNLRGVTVVPEDVLINITGESVTRTTMVPSRALPARVSQHVAIVRSNPNALDPRFLLLALLAAPAKGRLNGLSAAGATRRALTKAHLEDTLIPLPPLADQRRVSRILDTINALEEEVADLIRTRGELQPLLVSGKVRVSRDLTVA
jgi:type I restriction enzyme, S subunit